MNSYEHKNTSIRTSMRERFNIAIFIIFNYVIARRIARPKGVRFDEAIP